MRAARKRFAAGETTRSIAGPMSSPGGRSPWIMGLSDHTIGAVLAVSDLDAAKRFYEGGLGLTPGESDHQGVTYPCAEGTSLFVYLSPENAGRNPATAAGWAVDDLDAIMAELASRGAVFE